MFLTKTSKNNVSIMFSKKSTNILCLYIKDCNKKFKPVALGLKSSISSSGKIKLNQI